MFTESGIRFVGKHGERPLYWCDCKFFMMGNKFRALCTLFICYTTVLHIQISPAKSWSHVGSFLWRISLAMGNDSGIIIIIIIINLTQSRVTLEKGTSVEELPSLYWSEGLFLGALSWQLIYREGLYPLWVLLPLAGGSGYFKKLDQLQSTFLRGLCISPCLSPCSDFPLWLAMGCDPEEQSEVNPLLS